MAQYNKSNTGFLNEKVSNPTSQESGCSDSAQFAMISRPLPLFSVGGEETFDAETVSKNYFNPVVTHSTTTTSSSSSSNITPKPKPTTELCWKVGGSKYDQDYFDATPSYNHERFFWKFVNDNQHRDGGFHSEEGRRIRINDTLSYLIFPKEQNSYWEVKKKSFEPKIPIYNCFDNRLQSFTELHCPAVIARKAKEFAYCGFFYQGIEDYCKCFACGIVIHNWDLHDDIRYEHKRWAPNHYCPHLMKHFPEIFFN